MAIMGISGAAATGGAAVRRRGRWLGLGALALSALVLGLDATILVTALPTLSTELGATTSQLQWLSASFTLALAGLMLPAGVLADRYGRRRMLLLGLLLFGVASVVASQMSSVNGLIAMRALMGAGGAVILPMAVSILPTLFAEDERQRALGLTAAATFVGLPLGPLVSGWLLTHATWGWIFLINAPVVVLALVGVWFFIPESRDPVRRPLDWLGGVLVVSGVTGLIYGIIEQPANGWTDGRVLTGLAGGLVLVTLFTVRELRAASPLVDLRLFQRPRFAWATVAFTVVGFAMSGVLFVLTPYLQIVQGNDAQGTGLRLLPLIAAVVAGGLVTDRLSKRLGTKAIVTSGMVVCALGLALLSRAGAGTGYGLVAVALAVIGFGLIQAMVPALDSILGALPPAQFGAGNALTRTLQNIGASFGVAVMGSLLNSAYQSSLQTGLAGLPAPAREGALRSVAVAAAIAAKLPGAAGAGLLRAARDAYAGAMGEVLLASSALMLMGAVLIGVFLPATPATRGEEETPGRGGADPGAPVGVAGGMRENRS